MKKMADILEGFDDGQKVQVQLKNQDILILYDFEMVDESVYHRSDIVIATVSETLNSQFNFKQGTKIEISTLEIISLMDIKTEVIIFTRDI